MSGPDASLLANSLVHADLHGIHSHGVLRIPDHVAKLVHECVNPRGVPRVVRRTGGAVLVDGDNSMGQVGIATPMPCRPRPRGAGSARSSASTRSVSAFPPATRNRWCWTPHRQPRPTARSGSAIRRESRIQGTGPLIGTVSSTTDTAAALDGLIRLIGDFKGLGLAVCMGILPACCRARATAQSPAPWRQARSQAPTASSMRRSKLRSSGTSGPSGPGSTRWFARSGPPGVPSAPKRCMCPGPSSGNGGALPPGRHPAQRCDARSRLRGGRNPRRRLPARRTGYILNTPNRVGSTGRLSDAEIDSARTIRVWRGSMMPSSHNRADA